MCELLCSLYKGAKKAQPPRLENGSKLLGMGLDEYYNNMSDTRSIINVFLVLSFYFIFYALQLCSVLRHLVIDCN